MRIRFDKIGPIIKKNRLLRILVLLCGISVVLVVVFLAKGVSVRQEVTKIRTQIQANDLAYLNLQKMAQEAEQKAIKQSLFEKKSFSNFDEVIPFIAYLEKLFSAIDPEAQITIKSQEGQIFLDHFAETGVSLPGWHGLRCSRREFLLQPRQLPCSCCK